jgi:hypothetical protein
MTGQANLSFGPTVDGQIGEKKMLALGYEVSWGSPSVELGLGEWNEANGGIAEYGTLTAGLHVVTVEGLAARIAFGPAYVSQTDDRLSSLFEFHIQARIGLSMKSFETGAQFDHFSNAGIVPPNLGRDVVSLYISVPL